MAAGLGGNGENSRYNSISHCSVVVVKYHDQRQHKEGGDISQLMVPDE